MAYQPVNLGSAANDGTGDTLRAGGTKINANFVELYAGVGGSVTTFPGSPTTGQRAYRSDRQMEYFYDGTRWLSTQVFDAGPSVTQTTAGGTIYIGIPFAETYDIYVLNVLFHSQLTGGTTATNYYTFQFYSIDSTGTGTVLGSSQSTQNDTNNTVYARSQAVNAIVDMTSAQKALAIVTTRVGTQTLNGSFTVNYRLIG